MITIKKLDYGNIHNLQCFYIFYKFSVLQAKQDWVHKERYGGGVSDV